MDELQQNLIQTKIHNFFFLLSNQPKFKKKEKNIIDHVVFWQTKN